MPARYYCGLELDPNDPTMRKKLADATAAAEEAAATVKREPIVFAGVGIVVGLFFLYV